MKFKSFILKIIYLIGFMNVLLVNTNQIRKYEQHLQAKHFTKLNKLNICHICGCNSQKSIRCFKLNKDFNDIVIIHVNSTYFDNVHEQLKFLFVDFDFLNVNFKIDHDTFSKMKNLRILFLNNIIDLNTTPNLHSSVLIEEITIQNSNLKRIESNFCQNKKHLKKIDFSMNNLETLKYVFDNCNRLNLLDLSYNRLVSLKHMFNKQSNLLNLVLDNNLIEEINDDDLYYLTELNELYISRNRLEFIGQNAFDKLTKLIKLDLSNNRLLSLPIKSPAYGSLEIFRINGNKDLIYFPDDKQFYSLYDLRVHYAYHCCQFIKRSKEFQQFLIEKIYAKNKFNNDMQQYKYQKNELLANKYSNVHQTKEFDHLIKQDVMLIAKPIEKNKISLPSSSFELEINQDEFLNDENKASECNDIKKVSESFYLAFLCNKRTKNVKCSPEPDAFTPCEDLLESWWLRIAVWIISLLGILCNLSVISYNIMHNIYYYYNNSDLDVPAFLLTNLATADSLMSIYLLFIAVKDSTSRNNFDNSALIWQRSFSCNLAGFLSIVSSVSSALCLSFITFERYYAIKNSMNFEKRITIKIASIIAIIIWSISVFAAILPLVDLNNYSAYAICLPFDTRLKKFKIYIIGLNSLLVSCFFFICTFYLLIFINTMVLKRRASLTTCNNNDQLKLRNAEDQKLARNISLLVFVNIICWGPVVYVCAYSLIKMSFINRSYLKIIAVFVIPFNSLINPFLYCISRRSFRTYMRANLVKFRLIRNFGTSFSSSSTHSSVTTHTHA